MENSMSVFDNFRHLKNDMEDNGWVIDAFPFQYNNYNYIVLAKLYQDNEKRPKFALMKTKIMRRCDVSINITIPVNVNGFIIRTQDVKEFREFFGIEYAPNLGDILTQFTENFASFIPTQITLNKPDWLKDPMVSDLSSSDSENPNRRFCYDVRRSGNRSPFNDNKTRLLRANLYSLFSDDQSISFFYSSESEQEETDEEILAKFSRR